MTSRSENPGLTAARRLWKRGVRRGAPPDDDRPPPSTFPGRKPKLLPGQLDLDGQEHEGDGR
jgi:hypothetical protein